MAFAVQFAESVKSLAEIPAPIFRDSPVPGDWKTLATAVSDALSRGETHYTDRPGILPLRQQVTASLARRFGIEADAKSSTVITCGVVEARFVALQQLLAAGESVWAPDALRPDYVGPAYLRRANLATSIADAKLVCLASSLGEAAIRETLAAAPANAIVIFEAAADEATGYHPAQIEGFADRTITIGPIGYASWQMGYLVAPTKLAAGLRDFKQALTICSTNLSQWAALAAMEAR